MKALISACRTFVRGGGVFPLSPRVRNIGFALFIACILAYGAALSAHMLAKFDLINLIRDVNIDDSFYYFQIAANLAEGKFSTFDGGITRTNGYHPLWMLMITPFYWFFDREAALFAIKAFEIMLVAGAAALIAVAARLAKLPWILLFALPPLLYRHHSHSLIAGMEAAAALFTLGLLFAALALYARNPARWKWALAAVAFALPWARLEYVAISLAATGAMLFIEWSRRWRTNGAWSWRTLLSLDLVAPPLGAIAGILAYFAYNGIVFGGIVPVSGVTKQAWSQEIWEYEGGYNLARNLWESVAIDAFDYELLAAAGICILLLLLWAVFLRRSQSQEDRLALAFLIGMFSLAAGHLAKFAQTVLTIHPSNGGWGWYFVPAYLMMALLVPTICYAAIYLDRQLHRAKAAAIGIGLIGATLLLIETDFSVPFRFVNHSSETTHTLDWEVNSYAGTLIGNRLLPDNSVIGSWDAGVIGYFSHFPVVSLDGMVNSYDYFHETRGRLQQRGAFKPMHSELGITHLANHSAYVFDNKLYESRSFLEHRDAGMKFKLGSAEPLQDANAAVWFWERMEPHFDYQSDGVGSIVDGRLAQAFARDCAPDELAAWSWAGTRESSAAQPWTITQAGLCVSAIVLPHDALSPVRVESMSASEYEASLIETIRPPVIRSEFDVYMDESGGMLIYSRDDCADGAADPIFFLHVVPLNASDLPQHRRQYGFDNLDFGFEEYGVIHGEGCFAIRNLPHYNFTAIRTGQYAPEEGRIWEGEIRLGE